MAGKRGSREAGPDVSDHARLDQHTALTLPGAHSQHCTSASCIATSAAPTSPGNADPPGLVRQRPDLGDKRARLGRALASIPDPSRPDIEFVVVHRIGRRESGDGAENGRVAPVFGKAASRGAGAMALKDEQFQRSPPHPTALLLSCHPPSPCLLAPSLPHKPSPTPAMSRQSAKGAITAGCSPKRAQRDHRAEQQE